MNTGNHYRNVSDACDRQIAAARNMTAIDKAYGGSIPIEVFNAPYDEFSATMGAWWVANFYAKDARA